MNRRRCLELPLAAAGAGPEELLEKREFQAALADAMRQLSLPDRTILTLHYQEGRKMRGDRRNPRRASGNSATNLFRARERLKRMTAEWTSRCRIIAVRSGGGSGELLPILTEIEAEQVRRINKTLQAKLPALLYSTGYGDHCGGRS